jgi:hypothetical protein
LAAFNALRPSGVARYSLTGVANCYDEVELVNCYDGTSILNERYQPAGSVVTERTITLSGGAQDDVGIFSHKLVSNTNIDKYVNPLNSFWLDVENTAIGAANTATVEIISSLTLNNDDISLLLEFQGTSGSPVASFANTLPATPLTAASAIATSTATWSASPAPSTNSPSRRGQRSSGDTSNEPGAAPAVTGAPSASSAAHTREL